MQDGIHNEGQAHKNSSNRFNRPVALVAHTRRRQDANYMPIWGHHSVPFVFFCRVATPRWGPHFENPTSYLTETPGSLVSSLLIPSNPFTDIYTVHHPEMLIICLLTFHSSLLEVLAVH